MLKMNYDMYNVFLIYKKYYDILTKRNFNKEDYNRLWIKDQTILNILQNLKDKNIDYEKFFISNFTLRKKFFIKMAQKNTAYEIYYSFDEWLNINCKKYYIKVLTILNHINKNFNGLKIDFDEYFLYKVNRINEVNDCDIKQKFYNYIDENYHILSVLFPYIYDKIDFINDDKYRLITRIYLAMKLMKNFKILKRRVKDELL